MTFLNDLWKKFKSQPSSTKWDQSDVALEDPEAVVEAYQDLDIEQEQSSVRAKKLNTLRNLKPASDESALSLRFKQLKDNLGTDETYETVRQERWYPNIKCPSCDSKYIKRLPQHPNVSSSNHRYLCLDCHLEFQDDDELPTTQDLPPINIWMQCWYLMGCSDSLSYIATVLGLDLATVEFMAEQLRLLFNANAPMSSDLDFEEWEQQSLELRKQLQDDLLKRFEVLNANVSTTPKDTSEFRRQQNLRRTLTASTAPPPPKTGGNKRRR